MRIRDWSSDVCSSDLAVLHEDVQRVDVAVEPKRWARPRWRLHEIVPAAECGTCVDAVAERFEALPEPFVTLGEGHAAVRVEGSIRGSRPVQGCLELAELAGRVERIGERGAFGGDRKSTRLNSSH